MNRKLLGLLATLLTGGLLLSVTGQTNKFRTDQYGDLSVTGAKIANSTITPGKLVVSGTPTAGKTLTYSSPSTLAWTDPVAASVADGSITTAKLADPSVTSAKITDGTIATADLADNSVTIAKMADNAISGAEIVDGSVANAELGSQAVSTAKVALCPGFSFGQDTDGYALTYDFAGNCLKLAAAVGAPAPGGTTTTFGTYTGDLYNPGRGMSWDHNNANETLWDYWNASTKWTNAKRRTYVSFIKIDVNLCDGQASLAACSAMTTPNASVASGLASACTIAKDNGYKLSVKFVWYYPNDYGNPTATNFQTAISTMTSTMRACEEVVPLHMIGFGKYSEQWTDGCCGNLTAGSHNSFNYTGASAARDAYDNALLTTPQCFRRPDYMENTGVGGGFPITDTAQYWSPTGAAAMCYQNDSLMGSSPTENGTYGVNGGDVAQQKADIQLHTQWVISTGEIASDLGGIQDVALQTFNAATQYLKDYNVLHYRTFSHGTSNVCNANPCDATKGLYGSLNNGAGTTLGQWIERNLGYRWRLVSTTLPTTITNGTPFNWAFTMANDGTSAAGEGRYVQLVLTSGGGTVNRYNLWATPTATGYNINNPRAWLPEQNSTSSGSFTITGLTPGTYRVGLAFPDKDPDLQTSTNMRWYSVQLANASSPSGGNGAVVFDSAAAVGVNYLKNSGNADITMVVN